jgi:hypothetical protein
MKAAERAAGRDAIGSDEPADRAHYDEYVRGFDEIPVLEDAVRIPPRPVRPPSFVQGERRSLRREERPDGYSLREQHLAELEALYGEYVAPQAVGRKRKQPRAKAKKKAPAPKRRRKSSAAA